MLTTEAYNTRHAEYQINTTYSDTKSRMKTIIKDNFKLTLNFWNKHYEY